MVQTRSTEDRKNKKNTVALYILIVALVAQFAVPTYGIIKDFLGQDEYVFVLGGTSVHAEVNRRKASDILGAMLDYLFPPDRTGEGGVVTPPEEEDVDGPVVPDDKDDDEGEQPDTKPDRPPKPPKPDDSKPDPETPGDIGVEDKDTAYCDSADINIFGDRKRIAPGDFGTYKFKVINESDDTHFYDVTLSAIDTLPDGAKIPMEFRLQREEEFVTGNEAWTGTLEHLYEDRQVDAGKEVTYTLHWRWPESDDDNKFIPYGDRVEFSYTLTVTVTAEPV